MGENLFSSNGFISSGNWSPGGLSSGFPSPWLDMASLAMPETIQYALRWTEFLTMANGTYFRALDRVLAYFITDIEIRDVTDDKEKQNIYDFLTNPAGIDILNDIHVAGMNYLVYGNDFSSVTMPFRRYLVCPKCSFDLPLKIVYETSDFKFKWDNFEFTAYCPRCNFKGKWLYRDRRTGEADKIKLKHWSPHEFDILWCPRTDNVDFIWKIPEDYRRMIKEGKLHHLENADREIIECVRDNKHLKFEKGVIHHMKEPTLAGIRNRGWGVSRVLTNFRQAWYVQVLHRYNEAIALDYVIPFRLITPAPGPGSGDQARDTLLNLNMGNYTAQIQRMIAQRRKDPATWHTLPFAVQYQAIGGDATQLAPRDLLDQGLEILLNNIGVPVELYKGSLQIQSAPTALRLFESSWSHLVHNLNSYVAFVMRKLSQLMNWENATARLQKVTHADDLQRQMAKLQLMMGGQLSKQTGLRTVGEDYFDEVKRQMEEQQFEAEEQSRMEKEMTQAATMAEMAAPPQQMGGMPPGVGGGMPPGVGTPTGNAVANMMAQQPTMMNKPTTPQEMMQHAHLRAQQILTMPESQKDSELIQLSKIDPMMHTLVSDQLSKIKRQAQLAGGAMLLAQQYGKIASVLDGLKDDKPENK